MQKKVPTQKLAIKDVFGIDSDLEVSALAESSPAVPEVDENYVFNEEVTRAVLAGFEKNRRVMVQGLHGTGKTTHIEQICARLNWPVVRVNLDGQISRIELVGKDVIALRDGQQVVEFQEGIIPWALQQPMALVFDEYDAARPEVMFVIQRLLERNGKFALLEENRVIEPHPQFRLFATSNTTGLGDFSGMYHGTRSLNHAQLDRWDMTVSLNFLELEVERSIVESSVPELNDRETLDAMLSLAYLTRNGFKAGDISTLMTPRTVISWAENLVIFNDVFFAFRVTFLNR
ncbi:UNVERIFIED_CONTAM: hypothetical protein GTU68_031610, partial [Idotea baltica]|nr:hypothetical protein [Idotea baltica]